MAPSSRGTCASPRGFASPPSEGEHIAVALVAGHVFLLAPRTSSTVYRPSGEKGGVMKRWDVVMVVVIGLAVATGARSASASQAHAHASCPHRPADAHGAGVDHRH